ncbi:cation transporter [Marinitoga sp. 1135]|uniref:Trk-type K+ transport system, membrane component n=1 Tax=Marinitoga piezophila (strain DSM 14283 / JCM 11233 / KA3) TaxID=443254 RepID=H2J632_MARPK|nr:MULTISPECIES: TrkH family potassium uptake protein [Marinitoga]AEX85093.1 Trk-type K+ transport system, membrane component [Marinitoga piezophila KA3]APT75598.1 cation transporter [Marinitoga sp. 1137]NUU95307.1 cation transporter [Marinitoga sp. 1135]NUU97241.1 cation transporter [Marinitoga sp. 1138]
MPKYLSNLKHRYKLIFKNTGTMLIYFGIALMLFGTLAIILYKDLPSFYSFFETGLITVFTGAFFILLSWGTENAPINIQDAIVIIFLVWTLSIFFSALPFVFSGILNIHHAIFESTSGWTTTGLTLVDVTKIPKIFLIWRSLMQYFGGAGFALIMVIATGALGVGLYQAEGRTDNVVPNLRDSAKIIFGIYLSWAGIGIILLTILAHMSFFDAFNHTLTALATGGFSTKIDSVGEFNNPVAEIIIMVLMIAGGTGFGVHYAALRRGDLFKKNPEPKTMFFILLFSIPMIAYFTTDKLYGPLNGIRHSAFQAISALTGTGFSTVTFNNWNNMGLLIMTILMILGGMMDSTSGGLKLFRVFVIWKIIVHQIKTYFKPEGSIFHIEVYKGISKKRISYDTLKDVIAVVFMYFIVYTIGVMVLLGYGYSMEDSLFEYASALSAVGLSIGITTPDSPLGVIWIETIGMYLGRLEFFVIYFAIIKMIRDIKDIIEIKIQEFRGGESF